MSAECEVLVNGKSCGVVAIGRCSFDGSAFCMTHQAKKYGPGLMVEVSYVDVCVSCYSDTTIEAAETYRRKREHEQRSRVTSLGQTVKQELIAAGVPLVGIRLNIVTRPRVTETRRLFGGVKRTVAQQQVGIWGNGWIIGE